MPFKLPSRGSYRAFYDLVPPPFYLGRYLDEDAAWQGLVHFRKQLREVAASDCVSAALARHLATSMCVPFPKPCSPLLCVVQQRVCGVCLARRVASARVALSNAGAWPKQVRTYPGTTQHVIRFSFRNFDCHLGSFQAHHIAHLALDAFW